MNQTFTRAAWLAAALAAMSLLSACQREESPQTIEQTPSGPVSIPVAIDQEATRTSVSEMTGAISFSMGDKLVISDGEKLYKGITSSTSTSGMFVMEDGFVSDRYEDFDFHATFAGFPADMVSSISLSTTNSAVQYNLPNSYWFNQVGGMDFNTAKVPCPMGGLYHAGGGISLKPVCSIVRFYITNVAAGTITFTFPTAVTGKALVCPATADELSGTGLASSRPTEIQASGLTSSGKTVTIYDVPATKPGESLCITIPVPAGTVPQNIVVTNDPADESLKRLASITGSSQSLVSGHGHRFADVSLVRQAFSVSATKQVLFSPGNLQYIGSAATPYWKFADNQWDYLGETTGQNSDATNVDRDLFGWATSGYNNKYPYMTSTTNSDYGPDVYSSWTSNSNQWDWGVHNTISNGGGYSWRTLTESEWYYLCESRRRSPRYALATVADVHGLILFPDVYIHPSGVAVINNADGNVSNYSDNTFDASAWSLLVQAGCAFLPAAGARHGTTLSAVGGASYYWSSTGNGSSEAWSLYFQGSSNGLVRPRFMTSHSYGGCVRLVREVN